MQEFLVYIIVLGAAAYLARVVWSALSGEKACGGCGSSCGAKKENTPPATQLVQIDLNRLNGKH